jgi:hypothetical protein
MNYKNYDSLNLEKDLLFEYYETEYDMAVYSITHKPTGIIAKKVLDMRNDNNPGTKEIQSNLLSTIKNKLNEDFSLKVAPIDKDCKEVLYTMRHISGAKAEMAVYATDSIDVSEILKNKILKEIL